MTNIVLIVRIANRSHKDHPYEDWTIYHAMLSTNYSMKKTLDIRHSVYQIYKV